MITVTSCFKLPLLMFDSVLLLATNFPSYSYSEICSGRRQCPPLHAWTVTQAERRGRPIEYIVYIGQ